MIDNHSHFKFTFLDQSKGVAAIIVIFSHITVYEIQMITVLNNSLELLFFSLHNPTFYYVAGFLFRFSIEKHSPRTLLARKSLDTLVVFILWSLVFFSIRFLFEYPALSPTKIMYEAINQMWFFPILFLGYTVLIIASKIRIPPAILSVVWFFLFVIMGFFYTPVSKAILYPFLMWIGFRDVPKDLKKQAPPIPRSLLLLTCLAAMVCSHQFGLDQVLSTPGIRFIFLHIMTVISCKLLPQWFFFLSQKGCSQYRCFLYTERILVVFGKSSLYLYVLQGIPLILYQNQSNKHFWAATLCFLVCILFPLMIKYMSKLSALSFLDYLLKPSRFFKEE